MTHVFTYIIQLSFVIVCTSSWDWHVPPLCPCCAFRTRCSLWRSTRRRSQTSSFTTKPSLCRARTIWSLCRSFRRLKRRLLMFQENGRERERGYIVNVKKKVQFAIIWLGFDFSTCSDSSDCNNSISQQIVCQLTICFTTCCFTIMFIIYVFARSAGLMGYGWVYL